jgi:hypothetical protein
MEYYPVDSDAGAQSAVGVGQGDPTIKALHEILPGWMVDGFGVRGPQEPRSREPMATPAPMIFGLPHGDTGGGETPAGTECQPTTPPGSGTHLWGVVDGTCQWVDTTTC